MTINYAAKQIILSNPGSCIKKATNAIIVPLDDEWGEPFVDMIIDGNKKLRACVDTGCLLNYMSPGQLKSIFSEGTQNGRFIQLNELQLANATTQAPTFEIAIDSRRNVPCLVGGETLSQFRPTFDYQNHRLILEPLGTQSYKPIKALGAGLAHVHSGHAREAVSELSEVITREPVLANLAYRGRAAAFEKLKMYAQAAQDYSKILAAYPAQSYTRRGWMNEELKHYELAINDYTKAISLLHNADTSSLADSETATYKEKSLHEELSWLYSHRLFIYSCLKKYALAIGDFNDCLFLGPCPASIYSGRAWNYDRLGESQKAIDDYTKAVSVDPHDVYPYRSRAIIYEQLKKHKQAEADFTAAIKLHPKESTGYLDQADFYLRTGQNKLANADEKMALRLQQKKCL